MLRTGLWFGFCLRFLAEHFFERGIFVGVDHSGKTAIEPRTGNHVSKFALRPLLRTL